MCGERDFLAVAFVNGRLHCGEVLGTTLQVEADELGKDVVAKTAELIDRFLVQADIRCARHLDIPPF
jgi:hypothetical protein